MYLSDKVSINQPEEAYTILTANKFARSAYNNWSLIVISPVK